MGTYAAYSHAWARYYRGQLLRGILTITYGTGASRLRAVDTENLPTGMMRLSGPPHRGERVSTAHLGDPSISAQLFFWLLALALPTAVIESQPTWRDPASSSMRRRCSMPRWPPFS